LSEDFFNELGWKGRSGARENDRFPSKAWADDELLSRGRCHADGGRWRMEELKGERWGEESIWLKQQARGVSFI